MKTHLLSILMLLFVTGAFAQEVDILDTLNGDFELGDSLWRFIEIDNGQVVNDLSTLEIIEDNGNHYAKWTQKYSPNHIEMVFDKWDPLAPPCLPDTTYTIKFDAYMESGYGTLVVCTGFFDADGGFLQDVKYYDLKNPGDKDAFPPEWAHYEQVVHSPANAAYLYIGFRIYNQAATDSAAAGGNPETQRWPSESESPTVVDIDSVKVILGTALTSVNEKYADNVVKIYPNPTVNFVNIQSTGSINEIHVFDISGKMVKSVKGNLGNSTKISLQQLADGIYFIKVKSKNATSFTKIIKH